MTTYDFTLMLGGIYELTDEFANAVYNAGCDDCTISMQNGTVFLAFSREAESEYEAHVSAIRAIRSIVGAPMEMDFVLTHDEIKGILEVE